MTRTIAELAERDRPREKLLEKGAAALSDRELLAVLLGKGIPGTDVLTLAGRLIRIIDEKGLGIRPEDLSGVPGVGPAKAAVILAAIEFSRRRIKPGGTRIKTTTDLLPYIRHYADRRQEHFLCASLNGANEIIGIRVISIGLVDRSPVHPREVFADALVDRASAVVVAHNHPSGGVEPSAADRAVTRELEAAGSLLGIPLLDHLIFDRTDHYSFLESGEL